MGHSGRRSRVLRLPGDLAVDVEEDDESDEHQGHDEDRRGADLQSGRLVRVEAEDAYTTRDPSGSAALAREKPVRSDAARVPGCCRCIAREEPPPPEDVRAGRFRCDRTPPAGPRAGAGLQNRTPSGNCPRGAREGIKGLDPRRGPSGLMTPLGASRPSPPSLPLCATPRHVTWKAGRRRVSLLRAPCVMLDLLFDKWQRPDRGSDSARSGSTREPVRAKGLASWPTREAPPVSPKVNQDLLAVPRSVPPPCVRV